MTYYISGPMTGLPEYNLPAFTVAATHLHFQGHNVVTPFDLQRTNLDTYRQQLRRDLAAICGKAEAIYMLSGWEQSPGARAEHAVAVALELHIAYEGDA